MLSSYQKEQRDLTEKLITLNNDIFQMDKYFSNSKKWIQAIGAYSEIKKLDKEIINELFQKILIHQAEKRNGKRYQEIELHYRYVGKIPAADGKSENAIVGTKHLTIK